VAINWNDNTKRRCFRLALEKVYPNEFDLRIFVDEELNENLARIAANNNLQVTAYDLVDWARAKGRLDDLFEAFCRENPNHPVIRDLRQQSLIGLPSKLVEGDWQTLFSLFSSDDFDDVKNAFRRAFRSVYDRSFQEMRPDRPPLNCLGDIRDLLTKYDNPILAVRFVEWAIAKLQRSYEEERRDRTTLERTALDRTTLDLTSLEQWRDRISQQHNVPLKPAESPQTTQTTTTGQAYLLVTLEGVGADVNVYPELRITGKEKPIGFGAEPKTCAVDQVADHLSRWIRQAEETDEISQCQEEDVVVEVFLPCKHLAEDVVMTWNVMDQRDRAVRLGTHRRLLVRSSERIRCRKTQKVLTQKWQQLETCVTEGTVCRQFHLQEVCPEEVGTLCALLKDGKAPGLKFVAQLPTDLRKRMDVLYDMIDAAIPIALWSSAMEEANPDILKTEFDELLRRANLTDFADLARHWRDQCNPSRNPSASARQIRLLCDRPDRLPNLPDPDRDEDLLVAS
jgi:glycerophosphoryl diester phosphodiesterase